MQSYSTKKYGNINSVLEYLNKPEKVKDTGSDDLLAQDHIIDAYNEMPIPINEFDPAIKIGRDNKFFIKREYLTKY